MVRYCDAKATLTTGETVTVYFKIGDRSGEPTISRDVIYKTKDDAGETYSWSEIVVIDFRDFYYTEGFAPKYMSGLDCNNYATNVTAIYLPSTIRTILHTSFTSNWKSLETVYFPKSLEVIDYNSFSGCPVSNIIIEEGPNLKTINSKAFEACKNLTFFDFEKNILKGR